MKKSLVHVVLNPSPILKQGQSQNLITLILGKTNKVYYKLVTFVIALFFHFLEHCVTMARKTDYVGLLLDYLVIISN